MNWKNHLVIGIASVAFFVYIMHTKLGWFNLKDPVTIIVLGFIATFSPLVSDLDHHKAKLRKTMMGFGFLILALGGLVYAVGQKTTIPIMREYWLLPVMLGGFVAALALIAPYAMRHRGFSHSILFCLLFGVAITFMFGKDYQLGTTALVGCYSHLLADGLLFKLK